MSYLELDDGILNHPKFVLAADRGGSGAIHMWLGLRAYCGQHITDGDIPKYMLKKVSGPERPRDREHALAVLIEVGLVEDRTDHYQLHDFLDWSSSREEIMERRRTNGMRSKLRASPELMRLVKERDGHACRYCLLPVDWADRRGPLGGTYDHVIPLSKGGLNELENIVVCCRGCNAKKGAKAPEERRMVLHSPGSRRQITTSSLPVPLLSSPAPLPSTPRESEERAPAPDEQGTWDGSERETACPLDIAQRAKALGIPQKLAESLKVDLAAVDALIHDFASYWTIGGGMGQKRRHWMRKLRENVRQEAKKPGGLPAPGALEHSNLARESRIVLKEIDQVERGRLEFEAEKARRAAVNGQ